MASLTRWTWVWVNSRSWWWTWRPGMLQFMGSQLDTTEWLNWNELNWYHFEEELMRKKKKWNNETKLIGWPTKSYTIPHNMTYFFLKVFVIQIILHLVDLHKIYKPYYTISCLHDLIHVSFYCVCILMGWPMKKEKVITWERKNPRILHKNRWEDTAFTLEGENLACDKSNISSTAMGRKALYKCRQISNDIAGIR